MQQKASHQSILYQIGHLEVLPANSLIIDGKQQIKIEPKAMDLLCHLIYNQGKVISIAQLIEELWQGIIVTEHTVRRLIAQLRKALKDSADAPKFIITVPRKGYQFSSGIEVLSKAVSEASIFSSKKGFESKFYQSIVVALILLLAVVVAGFSNPTHWLEQAAIEPITSLKGREMAPSYSPDGRAIIFSYAEDGSAFYQLRIRWLDQDQDFPLKNLQHSAFGAVWSPVSDEIAFVDLSHNACKVFIATLSNDWKKVNATKFLANCGQYTLPQLAWSNDGQALYFNSKESTNLGYHLYRYWLKSDTVEHLDLESQAPGWQFFRALPEPNGNGIAFLAHNAQRETSIFVQQDNLANFPIGLKELYHSEELIIHANWCANKLVFEQKGKLAELQPSGKARLLPLTNLDQPSYISCAHRGNDMLLVKANRQLSLFSRQNPRVSSDKESEDDFLHRSTADDNIPAWGNQSQKFAFYSNRSGSNELWLSENGNLSKLTHGDKNFDGNLILWSPDDTQLLTFIDKRLAIIDPENAQHQWLTEIEDQAIRACWSNFGNGVYYASAKDGEIHLRDIKTGSTHQVTHGGGLDCAASLDGRYLFYVKPDQFGLWQLDLATSQSELIIADFHVDNFYQPSQNGIYFHRLKNCPGAIYYYDYNSQEVSVVLNEFPGQGYGLTVSADESVISYAVMDNYQADIVRLAYRR